MKWIHNLSIRNKILFITLVVTYGSILLWFAAIMVHNIHKTRVSFNKNMGMGVKLIADYTIAPLSFNDTIELHNILLRAEAIPYMVGLAVYDKNNNLLSHFVNTAYTMPVAFPYKFNPRYFTNHDDLVFFITPITFKNSHLGFLAAYAETKSFRNEMKAYAFNLVLSLLVIAILAALGAFQLQKIISEPILHLASVSHYVAESGDYSTRVNRTSRDEITDLYHAFNNLLNQIELRDKNRDEIEKKLEIAKNKAIEADRLKTAFLTNISHELRTPMNAILGFSALLTESGISDEKRKQFVEIITQSGNTLLNLVEDILDISKIEAGQLKITHGPVHIGNVLDELYLSFLEIKNQRNLYDIELILNNNVDTSNLVLITDIHRLRQILMNLIGNALKFTEKGYVMFGVHDIADGKVIFYVKDTGIGISEEQLPYIFDRFTKIDNEKNRLFRGAGLGLAICKKLSELLEGEITVESTLGVGSKFYLTLPAKEVSVITSSQTKPKVVGSEINFSKHLDILIVEDDPHNFEFLKQVLSAFNISITHATNGQEAINYCQSKLYDVVLMDVKMPVVDGYEATKIIKRISSKQHIIMQTAYAGQPEIEKCIAVGCDDYITKPINAKQLIKKIFTLTTPQEPENQS